MKGGSLGSPGDDMPDRKNLTMPYVVTVGPDGDWEEPIARFSTLNHARSYVDWQAANTERRVYRVRRSRSEGTIYSAGTPSSLIDGER